MKHRTRSPEERAARRLRFRTTVIDLLLIIAAAALSAVGLYVFVYPTGFSPSGVDGIVTMIHAKTGWDAGLLSLVLNAPLILYAYFRLNKRYVVYTLLFMLISSVMLTGLETFRWIAPYVTETDRWIPTVFSGAILGCRTGIMLKIGGSTAGLDILGSALQKRRPTARIETSISLLGYAIVAASFFVYDRKIECLLLSCVQIFVANRTIGAVLKSTRNAIEAKIVTDDPEGISSEILAELKHGVTLVPCRGMFTQDEKTMLVTVINLDQVPALNRLARSHEHTFVYYTEAGGVWGNFRWRSNEPVK